ncbi:hypothetical protein BDB00DRAFT_850978 [Zychaea mexicana]|uniref:uncharacterized protein n=1 Tax=Zychaea mexicana TaxID=64656 RepID=UPI0022FE51DF|nr:uncharacterized protein BDB00DRAFT_850978 [Zychaea mexicana]KAI9487910.1 hypothetical protein BDB00DRAFT_850978 [Zychaea mexicana]
MVAAVAVKDFVAVHGHPEEKHRHGNQQGDHWLKACSLQGKGRGFVATQRVAAGTRVHTAEPLAAVVSQEWVPETCAWCFHFTYPKRMRFKADITLPTTADPANNSTKRKKKQNALMTTTIKDVMFCSESCRKQFHFHGHSEDESNLLLRSYHALEQEYNSRQKQHREYPEECNDKDDGHDIQLFDSEQVDITDDDQLSHWINRIWTSITRYSCFVQSQQRWIPDNAERTMMRLVACCLARRQSEAEYLFSERQHQAAVPKFDDLLNVQCNELTYVRRILDGINSDGIKSSTDRATERKQRELPDELLHIINMYSFFVSATSSLFDCPHAVFRAIYFREMSNSFGLWEMSQQQQKEKYSKNSSDVAFSDDVDDASDDIGNVTDDLELLGWGIYPSAVYFNHSCKANVKKIRDGRNMVFIAKHDIEQGEEACISYGCIEDSVQERRKRLLEHYHFICACTRCEEESTVTNPQ